MYALLRQPQQAYYLADAYYARSLQAGSSTDQLQDCARALHYAQEAFNSPLHRQRASTLLQTIQAHHHSLTAVSQQERALADYCTHVCRLFTRSGVPFQVEMVQQGPGGPWLALHEVVDLDEASGNPVVTVRLCFHVSASSPEPQPGVPEVALYAQYQGEAQRVVALHGMAAVPSPATVYEGKSAFDSIFPERLALNRDLVFLVYADRGALLRYARVLQQSARTLPDLLTAPAPSTATLAAAARHMVIVPLLYQRLHTLATAAASKALQRQIKGLQAEVPSTSLCEQFQTFPAFVDAYTYFHRLAETLRPLLDAPPPAETSQLPAEAEAPPRPVRPQRRLRHRRALRHAE